MTRQKRQLRQKQPANVRALSQSGRCVQTAVRTLI